MENRPILKRKDLILIAVLLLISLLVLGVFYLTDSSRSGYGIAVLSIDGKAVQKIDLAQDGEWEIPLDELYGVPILLEVKDHAIRFKKSQCPDHLCERYGFISRELQTAVCMPNRTVITIHSPSDARSIDVPS